MAFPDTPSGLTAELLVNGTWTDITHALDRGSVQIGRGHPDESVTVSPATLAMTLSNMTADFSPDNAMGAYYPYLVQNIPCRVSVPAAASYMRSESDASSGAQATVTALAGDADIAVDMTPDGEWTQVSYLATQWSSTANNRGWLFTLGADGTLGWAFTTDGTMGTFQQASSTVPVSAPAGGRMCARAAWNHTAGTVTFYTSAQPLNASPSWTQLGAVVTLTPAALFATTAQLGAVVASTSVNTDFATPGYYGRFHGLLLKGNGGTTAANPDFTAQAAGTTSFTDGAGKSWALAGTAEISAREYRGHFEMPDWPQSEPVYHPSGSGAVVDVTVAAAGGGLLRRYSQRNSPAASPVDRAIAQLAAAGNLAAAWPMDDAAGSSQLASATGGPAMTIGGSPQLASATPFPGSAALLTSAGATLSGAVQYAGAWTDDVARWLMQVPSGGEPNGTVIATMQTSGTVARADLAYGTGGTLTLKCYDVTGAVLGSAGPLTPFGTGGVNGQAVRVGIALRVVSFSVFGYIEVVRLDGQTATASANVATGGLGGVTSLTLAPSGGLASTVLGAGTVQPLWTAVTDILSPVQGWAGEPAGTRIARLCAESGIQFRGRGNPANTTLMGVQQPQTLSQMIQACADADLGVWTELRQCLGWGYVTRRALYAQAAVTALDYNQDHLSQWSSVPTRDDQVIVNDVTYSNVSGSSARAYAAPGQPIPGGRMSSLAPGSGGVGTYDPPYQVAIYRDSDLLNLAGWKLHLGTADQSRFPGIVIDLANRALSSMRTAILAMDLGHRLTLDHPPPWLGQNQVTQLAQMITEEIGPYAHLITVTGIPELPYQVAAEGASHAQSDGTTLSAGATSTAASLSFATAAGYPLWSTSGGDYPCGVMIAGERVTVTAVSGGSSPQTATVTRSVNGVVKAQLANAAVLVYPPPTAGL